MRKRRRERKEKKDEKEQWQKEEKKVRKDEERGVLTLLPLALLDPQKPTFGSQETRQPNAISFHTHTCLLVL